MGSHVTVSQYNAMEDTLADEIDYLRAKVKRLRNRHKHDIERISHALLCAIEDEQNPYSRMYTIDAETFDRLVDRLNDELFRPLMTRAEAAKQNDDDNATISTDEALQRLREQLEPGPDGTMDAAATGPLDERTP